MKCYNFYQQCEDYFATARATEPNQILFATSFLWNQINFHWQQHKRKHEGDSLVFIILDEFKAFLARR